MSEPTTAEQHAAAQAEEYGQYVAIRPIDVDGARAFNPGHPVPVSHVTQYGYLEAGLVQLVQPGQTTAQPVEPGSDTPIFDDTQHDTDDTQEH